MQTPIQSQLVVPVNQQIAPWADPSVLDLPPVVATQDTDTFRDHSDGDNPTGPPKVTVVDHGLPQGGVYLRLGVLALKGRGRSLGVVLRQG